MKYLLAHVITFFCSFILILLLPYYLNEEQYSNYAVITSAINFFIPLATFGLVPFIIRHYKNKDNRTFDLRYVTVRVFIFGLLSSIVIYSATVYFTENVRLIEYFFVIPLAFALSALSTVSSGYYRAANKHNKYFNIIATQKLILCSVVFLSFYFFDYLRTPKVFFYLTVLSLLISLVFVKLDFFPNDEEKQRSELGVITGLKYCAPIAMSNIILMAIPFYERSYILGYVSNIQFSQYVFNFELAAKITAIILLVLKIMVWPKIVGGEVSEELNKYYSVVRRTFLLTVIISAALVLFSNYFYESILDSVYSSHQLSNVGVFHGAIAFSMFTVLLYVVNLGFLLTGKTNCMMLVYVVILICHIILLFFFVPTHGLTGVIISILISQFFGLAIAIFLNRIFLIKYEDACDNCS